MIEFEFYCPRCEEEIDNQDEDICPHCGAMICFCEGCEHYVRWIDYDEEKELCTLCAENEDEDW